MISLRIGGVWTLLLCVHHLYSIINDGVCVVEYVGICGKRILPNSGIVGNGQECPNDRSSSPPKKRGGGIGGEGENSPGIIIGRNRSHGEGRRRSKPFPPSPFILPSLLSPPPPKQEQPQN